MMRRSRSYCQLSNLRTEKAIHVASGWRAGKFHSMLHVFDRQKHFVGNVDAQRNAAMFIGIVAP
jgi:hypothetical protein